MYKLKGIIKSAIAKIVLFFMYRGFRAAYRLDDEIRGEILSWGDEFKLTLSACGQGPSISFGPKDGGIIRYKNIENLDMDVRFKNIDTAFLVLTGRLSVVDSYIRHGIILKGNIGTAMSLIRCVDKIESYLFPDFIVSKLLNYSPERKVSKLRLYAAVLAGI